MSAFLSKVVKKLKSEPVAVWGALGTLGLNVAYFLNASSTILETVGSVLLLAGIPVVRPLVKPSSGALVTEAKVLVKDLVDAAPAAPVVPPVVPPAA